MIKLPDNIEYRIFDLSFKETTHRYIPKDDKIPIEEAEKNRKALVAATGAKEIVLLHQVHGADVYYAACGTEIGNEPKVDAAYTDKDGILIAIQTADCVPVLFFSEDGSIAGGCHAGWKGAKLGVCTQLVEAMSAKGRKNLSAIICPSIQQKSYEVDGDYYEAFLEDDAANASFFIPSKKAGHHMFDLSGFVRSKLEKLDLKNIYHIDDDTYSMPEKYPSYRRACHTGEFYPRNLLSTIMIKLK